MLHNRLDTHTHTHFFRAAPLARLGSFHSTLGGKVTRPPAQGGSAGAVDTALATLGYGYGSWFSLSKTLCDLHLQRRVRQAQSPTGRQRPRALHTELQDPVRLGLWAQALHTELQDPVTHLACCLMQCNLVLQASARLARFGFLDRPPAALGVFASLDRF